MTLANASRGDMMTFATPSGAQGGNLPVDATATFVTGTNTLAITLTNLQANPKSDIQSVNGLIFTFATTPSAVSLSSSSGNLVSIDGSGKPTGGGSTSTNWTVSFTSPSVTLSAIHPGNSQATETLIGPPAGTGNYEAANNSIAGSVHNPFLSQTATFTLNVTGLTPAIDIASVRFAFGTSAGTNVTGVQVPEPSSLALAGTGLVGACLILRRRRRRAAA